MGRGGSVYAVWEERSACRRAAGQDGEKERKGVRASNHQEAFPEPAESVSPWSVGSSNEEIDDHPITHVETMLHCPVGGKSTKQANLSRCSDRKQGLYRSTRSKAPRLFRFLTAFITRPSKPQLFFLMTGSHSKSFIFLGCTRNRHETVEPHDSQVT